MNCEDIEIEDLEGEQLDVAEAIGIDAYRELITIFPGSFIYIAKPETVLREKRNKRILDPVHIKLLQFDNKYVIMNT